MTQFEGGVRFVVLNNTQQFVRAESYEQAFKKLSFNAHTIVVGPSTKVKVSRNGKDLTWSYCLDDGLTMDDIYIDVIRRTCTQYKKV